MNSQYHNVLPLFGSPAFCRGLLGLLLMFTQPVPATAQDHPGNRPRVMLGIRFVENSPVLSFIKPNGPAFRAGLEVGDELFSIDQKYVLQSNDLLKALEPKRPGDVVQVEVLRRGQYRLFDLTVMTATRNGQRVASDGSILPPLPEYGLVGEPVPDFYISKWQGLPEGQTEMRLKDLRGKVVFLLLFQTTCEFSREDAMPLMSGMFQRYRDDPDVQFLAIQNSLPRFDENTLESAAKLCGEFDLPIPVGHDDSTIPTQSICKILDAPGTPWIILVDREGIVRFSDLPESLKDPEVLDKLKRGEKIATPLETGDPIEGDPDQDDDSLG